MARTNRNSKQDYEAARARKRAKRACAQLADVSHRLERSMRNPVDLHRVHDRYSPLVCQSVRNVTRALAVCQRIEERCKSTRRFKEASACAKASKKCQMALDAWNHISQAIINRAMQSQQMQRAA